MGNDSGIDFDPFPRGPTNAVSSGDPFLKNQFRIVAITSTESTHSYISRSIEFFNSKRSLVSAEMSVSFRNSLEDLMISIYGGKPDAILCELDLISADQFRAAELIIKQASDTALFAIGRGQAEYVLQLIRMGFEDYIDVRNEEQVLTSAIRYGIERSYRRRILRHDLTTLTELANDFGQLIRESRDCILVVNPAGFILMANPAAERILGSASQKLHGAFFMVPETDIGPCTVRFPGADESLVHGEVQFSPVKWGKVPAFLAIVRDNSQRDVAEEQARRYLEEVLELNESLMVTNAELAQMKERALEASDARERFFAAVSHEIRTPLSAVIGCGEALLLEPLTDAQRVEQIKTIVSSGSHLLNLVNNLLDFSRGRLKELVVEKESVKARELLTDIYALLRPLAQAKKLLIEFLVTPVSVPSDPYDVGLRNCLG